MRALLRRLNTAVAARPVGASLLVTGVKACAADALVQTAVEGKRLREIDHQRSLLFTSFGVMYQGGFQYWLINHAFESAFPGRSLMAVLKKVFAMNLIGRSWNLYL